MRFKSVKRSFVLVKALVFSLSFLSTGVAVAATTITPTLPYLAKEGAVSFAAKVAGVLQDTEQGYKSFDLTKSQTDADITQALSFELKTDDPLTAATGQQMVVGVFVSVSGGDPVAVPIGVLNDALCTSANCAAETAVSGVNYYLAAKISAAPKGETIKVGLFVKDICTVVQAVASATPISGSLCSGGATVVPDSARSTTISLTFGFGFADTTTSKLIYSDTNTRKASTLNVSMHGMAPAFTCPTDTATLYEPGDSSFFVRTDLLTPVSNAAAAFETVVIVAKKGGSVVLSEALSAGNDVVGRFDYNTGTKEMTGITNSTDGTDNLYELQFLARDRSGTLGSLANTAAGTGSECKVTQAAAAQIKGFIGESKCFIATASYGSMRAWPVVLLREFRDRVLLNYPLGQAFVEWYYGWSPEASDWVLDHQSFRSVLLLWLSPVVIWAWLLLNPLVISGLSVGFISLLLLMTMGSRTSSAAEPAGATESEHLSEHLSEQPYIDELKKDLAEEGENSSQKSIDEPASYTEKIRVELKKKEIEENGESTGGSEKNAGGEKPSYTDEIKADLKEADSKNEEARSFEGYTAREKARLAPTETKSVLNKSEVEKEYEVKKQGEVTRSMSLHVSASSQRSFKTTGGTAGADFGSCYTSKWYPEINLLSEIQLAHSDTIGSIGGLLSTGMSYYSGKGQFAVAINKPNGSTEKFSTNSNISLSLMTVPVLVGAEVRVNLLRIIQPFVFGSAGPIVYVETRSDAQKSQRGYAFVAQYGGGLNLNLDVLMPKTSFDLYGSFGVKHYFLSFQYLAQQNLSGNVAFNTSNLEAGLTYEF